ncbi:MAG: fibronectin type III domain-containing protein [Spirochaetales bacterium]
MNRKLYGSFLLVFFLITSFSASPEPVTPRTTQHLTGISLFDSPMHGTYEVFSYVEGEWRLCGQMGAGKDYRNYNVELILSKTGTDHEKTRVRIVQRGGGAAHVDSVTLNGEGPISAHVIKGQTEDPLLLKKLQAIDHDVVDVFGKTLELVFPSGVSSSLVLNARIEGLQISTTPFAFPQSNQFKKITNSSQFFTYALGSKKEFSKEPDFKVYCLPGSGHPAGWVLGWMANDAKNLYFRLDFTPDNTMDGSKDYARLYIKTGSHLKLFTQSVQETTYGLPDFTYTDIVAYQHKVYKFTIPLTEILEESKTQWIYYTVEAYGTASPRLGYTFPFLAFDPAKNRYLLVYARSLDGGSLLLKPYYQFYSWDLLPLGQEQGISDSEEYYTLSSEEAPPSAAFASDGSALIVWPEGDGPTKIWARKLNGEGSPSEQRILLSDATYFPARPCSVAYDPGTNKFFVVWTQKDTNDQYKIKGCFISATTGVKEPSFFLTEELNSYQPQVVYTGGDFLVVWQTGSDEIFCRKFSPNGTPLGTNPIQVANESGNTFPSVAYAPGSKKFLVVWADVDGTRVFARLLNSDGTPSGETFPISPEEACDVRYPHVVYSNRENLFLVTWNTIVSESSTGCYQSKINTNGSLNGTAVRIETGDYTNCPGGIAQVVNTRNGDTLTVISVYKNGEYRLATSRFDYPNGAPPPAAVLQYPADRAIVSGSTVTLKWEAVSGTGILYRVYCSTDSNFSDSAAYILVASDPQSNFVALAGFGFFSMITLLFAVVSYPPSVISNKKRKSLLLLLGMISGCFLILALLSCPSEVSSPPIEEPTLKQYTITNLSPGTTYYWKVVTDNGESLSPSSVRSFTTN